MNLYLIKRPEGDSGGYDTYRGAVVVATDETDAQSIHPGSGDEDFMELVNGHPEWEMDPCGFAYRWVSMDKVVVTYLGQADPKLKRGVVLDAYWAG